MNSEILANTLIDKIRSQGARVDALNFTFYIKEGTLPTKEMKILKKLGFIGQYEIR